jgi:peptide/nickel transport system substrate-binding protein
VNAGIGVGNDPTSEYQWYDGVQMAYEPLLNQRANGTFTPGLATSWKVARGNESVTLTLRHDARFSDGTLVDAKAVKTWFDYMAAKPPFPEMGPVASTTVLSKWVVRLRLKAPNEFLLQALAGPLTVSFFPSVLSPKLVNYVKKHPSSRILGQETDGAGPYVLVPSQTVPGDHYTFVPNKYFYDKSQIHWGKIVLKALTDPNAILAAMETGQVDVSQAIDPTEGNAAKTAGIKIIQGPGYTPTIFFSDHSGKLLPALGHVGVRQALNYAVNRKLIANALWPYSVPTDIPNSASVADPPHYANYYTYNPAKARALLAAAGYPNGFTMSMLCISVAGFDTTAMCSELQKLFAAIGVTLKLTLSPTFSDWGTQSVAGTFDSVAWGGYGGVSPAYWYEANVKLQSTPSAFADQHGWHDPVLDSLFNRAERATPKRALGLWKDMDRRMIQQADFIPIANRHNITLVGKRVAGVRPFDVISVTNSILDWYPAHS